MTIGKTATRSDWARAPRGGLRGQNSPVHPATFASPTPLTRKKEITMTKSHTVTDADTGTAADTDADTGTAADADTNAG